MVEIDSKDFIAKYYSTYNALRQRDVERFVTHVANVAESKNLTLTNALQDEAALKDMFFLQGAAGDISRSHYQKIKKYISDLMDMCKVSVPIPTREEVLSSKERYGLFKSLDSVIELIDKVGVAYRGAEYHPSDLIVVKAICVLGWNMITPQEMSKLKTNDLKFGEEGKCFVLQTDSKSITFEGASFEILLQLERTEAYRSIPDGKKMSLVDSDYLLRPAKVGKAGENLTASGIVSSLQNFNVQIPSAFKKTITFRNLRKNALFLKIYNDKKEETLTNKIMRIMDTDRISALSYEQQYLGFAKVLKSGSL